MRTLLFILFFLFSRGVLAQEIAIQTDRGNIAYIGLENPITVVVEGYKSSALVVSVDNGSIDKDYKGDGAYIVTPKYPRDSLTICIQARTSKGIKDLLKYKVKLQCVQIESTTFAGHSGGLITVGEVRMTNHLDGSNALDKFVFGPHFHVTGCKIRVIHDGNEILSKSLYNRKGVDFYADPEVSRVWSNIKAGDRIIFTNITYLGYGECTGTMKPMEFVAN